MEEIDLVVPMVFPQDYEWHREYTLFHGDDATGHVRFRSWGTEELLVRCCMKYMPWLHRIYILLARESQVQPWMNAMVGDGKPVIIVYHREFMPDRALPCFSSPCIEMFLKDIPGLSEHFIYANDDMFPLSPLEPDDFFRDGRPCQIMKKAACPSRPTLFHKFVINGLNMVAEPFGKRYTRTFLKNGHSLAPYLKSACEEVWRRHGREILSHLNPICRSAHSYCQYIYADYQYLAGLSVEHGPKIRYAGSDTPTSQLAAIIRDPDCGIVCLNDNEDIDDWRERAELVKKAIEAKLADEDTDPDSPADDTEEPGEADSDDDDGDGQEDTVEEEEAREGARPDTAERRHDDVPHGLRNTKTCGNRNIRVACCPCICPRGAVS